jgi:Fe-S-cluster containining protein
VSESFDFPNFQATISRSAATVLAAGHAAKDQAAAARAVQRLSEETLLQHQQNTDHIACRAGCGHCCQVNVAVLPAEAEAILASLTSSLSLAEMIILRQKATQLHLRVGGLSDDDRLLARASCLFLDPWGNCSIYPVRPLLCRSVTSIDPEACRDAVTLAALGEEPRVTSHLFQQELFQHAFLGLADALSETGLDNRSQQLTEAVWEGLADT